MRIKHRAVAIWLLSCCAMIFIMVVLGALTRLTQSGLSIVDWRPLTGVLPPLSEAAWQQAFAQYRQSPEYIKVNSGMILADYKAIFWLEYLHRLWGRLIGVAFALPALWFAWRGLLPRLLKPKLLLMFVLGGLQGLLGWFMVASGLVDDPHVSPYRLTAHLALAFAVYAYILWVALGLLWAPQRNESGAPVHPTHPTHPTHPAQLRRLRCGAVTLLLLVSITIISGGLVAGLRAGYAFNDFPWMAGKLIPDGLLALHPRFSNFTHNIITVQFQHRALAFITLLAVVAWWWQGRQWVLHPSAIVLQQRQSSGTQRQLARLGWWLNAMLGVAAAQVALGIVTLLTHVNIAVATWHQALGLLLLTAVVGVARALFCLPAG